MEYKIGRPPTYKKPSELLEKAKKYIAECEILTEPLTITGVCLYCGFESRQSFYAYEKKSDFSYTIKSIRLVIENSYELKLHGKSYSGAIFALKNMGWSDKQEIDHTTGGDKISYKINLIDGNRNGLPEE